MGRTSCCNRTYFSPFFPGQISRRRKRFSHAGTSWRREDPLQSEGRFKIGTGRYEGLGATVESASSSGDVEIAGAKCALAEFEVGNDRGALQKARNLLRRHVTSSVERSRCRAFTITLDSSSFSARVSKATPP